MSGEGGKEQFCELELDPRYMGFRHASTLCTSLHDPKKLGGMREFLTFFAEFQQAKVCARQAVF